jgi:hypothetical protein
MASIRAILRRFFVPAPSPAFRFFPLGCGFAALCLGAFVVQKSVSVRGHRISFDFGISAFGFFLYPPFSKKPLTVGPNRINIRPSVSLLSKFVRTE